MQSHVSRQHIAARERPLTNVALVTFDDASAGAAVHCPAGALVTGGQVLDQPVVQIKTFKGEK